MATRPRILLAKPGLDGHDRGVKVIALGLRDAGAEVIYLGLRQTTDMIVDAAEAEDVDTVGISVLSGAHVALTRKLLATMGASGLDTPVVVGGTVPARDMEPLLAAGAAAVFPAGSQLPDVIAGILAQAGVPR